MVDFVKSNILDRQADYAHAINLTACHLNLNDSKQFYAYSLLWCYFNSLNIEVKP